MILDQIKSSTDDAFFTEDHVLYLINKYRALLLKQKYSDIRKQIPESNYQTICLEVEPTTLKNSDCEAGTYLRSKEQIPYLMKIGNPLVHPIDYYSGNITYISRERMRFVGHNKYLQNIIYCSIGPDNYLYFKSPNPQHMHLKNVRVTGIFEDFEKASELQCENEEEEKACDILDREFPLEDALIPVVLESVIKDLLGASYRPEDDTNNASDELNKVASQSKSNQQS